MNSFLVESVVSQAKAEVWLEIVREQVRTLQFGVVQITVHDSKVVQVERTERVRIAHPASHKNLTADPTAEP